MTLPEGKTFDVIIVGAGPAGCVLASRLSEEADKQILLIEAGPDAAAPGAEHPDVLDPFCLTVIHNRAFFWGGLKAETGADHGDGSGRASGPYLQGLGVGGASNINGMGVDRGLPDDYEEWHALGAHGWDWRGVLPYFKKLEHDFDFSGPEHGKDGPMPVRRLPRSRWAPFAAAVGEALERRGYPFIEDYLTDFRDGLAPVPTNCLPERRVSAAMAYLTREVRQRPNLKIMAGTKVDRLSLAGSRANGVFASVDGGTRLIRGRQIILCGGALQSPALLLRSGIGPAKQLKRHGITVVLDRAGVGANLQNHPSISLSVFLPRKTAQGEDNPWFLQNWLRFSSRHPECAPSDMHLMAFNKAAWHALGRRVGLIAVSVLKSYSKGSVELSSPDPAQPPSVRFNLFEDARDEERLVAGVRFALELLTDRAVSSLRHELFLPNNRLVAALSPRNVWNGLRARAIASLLDHAPLRRLLFGASRLDPDKLLVDGEALRSFVRKRAHVQFHVCGTCPMGRANDAGAVVDEAGQVYGIDALRVADASIFPTVPRGYTHFIVLMAAEKIADAVKADWHA